MPSWFHEILSDLDTLQIGIHFNGADSVVETLPDRKYSRVFAGIKTRNPHYLKDGWVSFYDYGNKEYGVLNYVDSTLWSLHGEPNYCGRDSHAECLAVQIGNELRHQSLRTGELVDVSEVSGKIVAMGSNWALSQDNSKVSLTIGHKMSYSFQRRGNIYEVVESGGYVVMIERQGMIRVIDLATGALAFERNAPEGSEYRRAAITESGLLSYTHHYFDRPTTTITHQRALKQGDDLNTKEIPISGCYHLRKRGLEIFFATCAVYCSTTGIHLLDARDTRA